MAHSQFSETQFVFGYLNELFISQSSLYPWSYFMFPSTVVEKILPVDFFVDHYTHSEFYQFKRSEHLSFRRGNAEIHAGVPSAFLDYYRFKIYNKATHAKAGQFDKLKELALHFPTDLVCYCAPCFHTDWEFHHHFTNRTILENSILIECYQFNNSNFNPPSFDINDGYDHFMVFKKTSPFGYICSEPKEIKLTNPKEIMERNYNDKNDIKTTLRVLYYEVYLKDEFYLNEQNDKIFSNERDLINKVSSDDFVEQIKIVTSYLFTRYDILWQPKFKI